jgi:hypothetical protein
VTDNGSNFTKAFREFGIVMNQQSDDDSSDDDEAEDFASGDLTFESVDQITQWRLQRYRTWNHSTTTSSFVPVILSAS